MAHPHAEHRQNKVERSRVSHITKGYASGGAVHSDEAEDKALIKKEVKKTALKMDGKHPKERADRRARGGRTKHKGSGKTNVNVIIAPHSGAPAGGPPMAPPGVGAAPMPPRPMPMPPPGAGGPPGAMPPPGMAPHKSGGRAYAKGGAVKSGPGWTESMDDRKPYVSTDSNNKSDGKDIGRGKVVTYAKGGKVGQTPTGTNPKADTGGGIIGRKAGGRVEAPNGKSGMGPKFDGGGGGGIARLEKAKRARKDYAAA